MPMTCQINYTRKPLIVVVVTVFLFLAACTEVAVTPQPEHPPLRMEYTLWWSDYTMFVAQELNLFEKHGVAVEPVFYEVFSEALPAMATGAIDGGVFGPGDALSTASKTPLKVVGVTDDGGFNYVIGAPDIETAADLRGKRIGVPVGTTYEIFALQALAEGGLAADDAVLINMEVEDIAANLGKTIDAGYTWDPYASEALAAGATLLLKSGSSETLTPNVVVFRAEVVEQRPDDVRAYLKAWFEAVDYRHNNPEEASRIIAETLEIAPEELSEDAQLFTAQENIALFSDQAQGNTLNLNEIFKLNGNFLIRIGVLGAEPDLSALLDGTYLP